MSPLRLHRVLESIDNFLEALIILVVGLFIAVILPIILFQLLFFWLLRKTVFLGARTFKRFNFSKPLTLHSAMLANIDPIYTSPKLSIVGALVLRGVPDLQQIRKTVKTQLLDKVDPETGQPVYPELLQNVEHWMGYPFWRKLDHTEFNQDLFLRECVHFYGDDGN